jgi:hypothetical protein
MAGPADGHGGGSSLFGSRFASAFHHSWSQIDPFSNTPDTSTVEPAGPEVEESTTGGPLSPLGIGHADRLTDEVG